MCADSLKICFVSMQYPPLTLGGAGVYAHCLCTELSKLGHEVHVVSPTIHKEHTQTTKNGIFIHRIPVVNKPMLKTSSYWLRLRKCYRKLQEEIKFDLLHANVTSDLSLTKNQVKTPRVVTIHHLAKTTFNAVDTSPLQSFGNMQGETSILSRLEKKLGDFDKIVIRRADKIIAVSEFTKKTITSTYHIPSSKIHVVYNGIYPALYNCSKTEIKQTKTTYNVENMPTILYVGRIEPRKGLVFLLKAFVLLSKDIQCRLVIAGSGNQTLLKKLAEKLRITEKIVFIIDIDDVALKHLYNACDVFVLPSLLEGFGLTILEAMAAGKPVVATNVGGIPEIMKNNIHGKLVEPKNPVQLSKALGFYLKNPKIAKKMGEHNRKYVTENFSWIKTASETALLYKTLIAKPQGCSA
jgi:glycosyltransferase involved in cell wall biosynthesis